MKKQGRRKAFADLLHSRNITAYKLAELLEYKDKTAVYKWIYRKGEPNSATMLRLMDILEVSAAEILRMFAE